MDITQTLLKNHLRYEDGFLYWTDFSIRPNAVSYTHLRAHETG
jgi:hypothetical protein